MAAPPSSSAPMPIAMSTRGWVTRATKRRHSGVRRERGALHRDPLERRSFMRDAGGRRYRGRGRRPRLGRRFCGGGLLGSQQLLELAARRDPGSPRWRRCRRRVAGSRSIQVRIRWTSRRWERYSGRSSTIATSAPSATNPVALSKISEICIAGQNSASSWPITSASGALPDSCRTSSTIGVTGVSPSWSETVRARSSASASALGST